MSDNLVIGGATFTGVTGIKATDTNDNTVTYMSGDYTAGDLLDPSKPVGVITSNLVSVSLQYAINGRNNITGIRLPEATSLGLRTLQNGRFTSLYAPKLQTLGQACMQGCTKITVLVLPSLKNISGNDALNGCTTLVSADFGGIYSSGNGIANYAFNGCSVFKTLVLRSTTAWALQNINAFANSCFKSGGTGGTLYVPNDLISTYQGATNWSTILGYTNNQIKSIESTHTDPNAPIDLTTHYVDGTLISTT